MTIDGKEDPGLSKFLSFRHSAVVIKITYLKRIFYYIMVIELSGVQFGLKSYA